MKRVGSLSILLISSKWLLAEAATAQTTPCFEVGVDYEGYDVQKFEDGSIPSAGACQEMCQRRKDCSYFSFVPETSSCYIKDAYALQGRKQDATTAGVVSGPKFCTTPDSS
ncbi:pan domain-containing protein, partial [Cystoisospora suis]